MSDDLKFSVSDFVALLNQTLEFAYPTVMVSGELANFRVSKGRWVYFDLKDELATVRFFGTVYQLPGPLEDGMVITVKGTPRLHQQYGFSVNVISMRPEGEGSIKKAAALLESKLAAEGLFDAERKRPLPYPPRHIGLVASGESAAYRDFVKVLGARWGGMEITHIDVQVQGEASPAQVVAAIEQLNGMAVPPEVIVVTRGGGSAEDLQAFSTEQVTRAVAASRIPTLVAIGHEVDISLAELAADQRASTPSNAAELLVPDRRTMLDLVDRARQRLGDEAARVVQIAMTQAQSTRLALGETAGAACMQAAQRLGVARQLLAAYDPHRALQRGYAIVRRGGHLAADASALSPGDELDVQLQDAHVTATVKAISMNTERKA